jgi:hypothetical protein
VCNSRCIRAFDVQVIETRRRTTLSDWFAWENTLGRGIGGAAISVPVIPFDAASIITRGIPGLVVSTWKLPLFRLAGAQWGV